MDETPGICEYVQSLASALDANVRACDIEDAELLSFLAAVGSMPEWKAKHRLDLWEQRAMREPFDPEAPGRKFDPSSQLAWEIFELGRHNLYAAINTESTRCAAERVSSLLEEVDVSEIPRADTFDLSVW